MPHTLSAVAAAVFALNLPFGYWRAAVRRLTWPWFVAVHAPVPLVVGLRLWAGIGWHLTTVPVLVGAFFTGQLVGGRMRHWRNRGA